MAQSDSPEQLIQRLLEIPSAEDRSLERLVAAANGVGSRLQASLGPILGSLGVRLITERALQDASARYPFLPGIAVYDDGLDAGALLGEMTDNDYDNALRGFEELFHRFSELLAQLLGVDLSATLLQEALAKEAEQ